MKKMLSFLTVMITAIVFSGCALSKEDLAKIEKDCKTKSGDFIYHKGECLETKFIKGTNSEFINILIHGNPGGPNRPEMLKDTTKFAQELANKTSYTTFYYTRPNYGKSSSNVWHPIKKQTQEIKEDYIQFNASFFKKLMSKTNAKKVNLIAFAAGTTVGANVAALNHDIINKVVLIGGQYNIYKQKILEAEAMGGCKECRKKNMRIASIGFTPQENVDKLNKNSKFLIIAGDQDKICPKKLSQEYVEELKIHNIPHKYILVKQEGKFYSPKNGHEALFLDPKTWNHTIEFINE
jgi:pimeloyl-ACP methyl ester carboxylesterase